VGGLIAQAEAYSFGDIDGLMVLSYSDTNVSLAAKTALTIATQQCTAGGQRQSGNSGPTGYIYFGADTAAKFIEAHFYPPNADPTVVETTAGLRSRDPCGDILSYKTAVASNLANIAKITIPTLVVIGAEDAIYPVRADKQASLLTGSSDVTPITIAGSGPRAHLAPERRNVLRAGVELVDADGFGGWAMPIGAPNTGGGSAAAQDRSAMEMIWGGVLLALGLGGGLILYRRRETR